MYAWGARSVRSPTGVAGRRSTVPYRRRAVQVLSPLRLLRDVDTVAVMDTPPGQPGAVDAFVKWIQ